MHLLTYAYFIELKEMEKQGTLRWEKKRVEEQNYIQIKKRVSP